MAQKHDNNVTETYIIRSPELCGGEPCIAGRRIKVRHVYVWYDLMGMSADEIASRYDLTLAQVHGALAYAYEHLDDIRQAIRSADGLVESLRLQTPSKFPRSLTENDDA